VTPPPDLRLSRQEIEVLIVWAETEDTTPVNFARALRQLLARQDELEAHIKNAEAVISADCLAMQPGIGRALREHWTRVASAKMEAHMAAYPTEDALNAR
jgi:hypothetical protein